MLVRLFDDPDVAHTMGGVDPRRDVEVVETELILADLAGVEKQIEKLTGKAKTGEKEARQAMALLEKIRAGLSAGKPVRALDLPIGDVKGLNSLAIQEFLTAKPVLFVGNTDEKADPKRVADLEALAKERGAGCVCLCGKLEAEIAQLEPQERIAFLSELGISSTGLERVIVAAYKLLNQQSFFTIGDYEVRAWTVTAGFRAPQAAGLIHTDFEKGFIKADVYHFSDMDTHGKESILREKGMIRSEGKEYVVKDGDVCFFKFSPPSR
jgi:hypothetical protein